MGSTTTQTTIINRALQLLGYKPVSSINDLDRGARAMNQAYYPVLNSTLRANFWNFSIKRATLAADAENTPAFGPSFYYNLPGDFVCLAMPDQIFVYAFGVAVAPTTNSNAQYNDWQIEDNNGTTAIASSMQSPIQIRYVSNAITEGNFDPSFAEAFSANLALETCEALTNSNTKLEAIGKMYEGAIESARKRNAFEMKPIRPPIDTYILSRY
jgi:hypothetical protein